MTNEELKKKIVEVVLNSEITGIQIRDITGGYSMANNIADALIAAGIGDVTEWKEKAKKHRVQVLPDGTIKQLYSDEEVEDIARQRDEYKHRAEVAERALLLLCDGTMKKYLEIFFKSTNTRVRNKQELYDYYIKQAEKELAEEEKE